MPKNKKPKSRILRETASALPESGRRIVPSDITGSYTGTAWDKGPPEQDADDL